MAKLIPAPIIAVVSDMVSSCETHASLDSLAGVNYLDRPATTILAGWKRGTISSVKLVSAPSSLHH